MNHDGSPGPSPGRDPLREHLRRIESQLVRTEDLLRAMDALPHRDWTARQDAFLSELAALSRRERGR